MTEQYYDDDDDAVDEQPQRTDSEWAELRRAKKAKEKAEKELAQYKRAETFRKAGIDTDDPRFAYFAKGYDGDLTADAIREEAIRAGFVQEQPEAPEGDPAEVEAAARVQQAAGAGVDQPELVEAALQQAYDEGGTEGMMQFLASQGVPTRLVQ